MRVITDIESLNHYIEHVITREGKIIFENGTEIEKKENDERCRIKRKETSVYYVDSYTAYKIIIDFLQHTEIITIIIKELEINRNLMSMDLIDRYINVCIPVKNKVKKQLKNYYIIINENIIKKRRVIYNV